MHYKYEGPNLILKSVVRFRDGVTCSREASRKLYRAGGGLVDFEMAAGGWRLGGRGAWLPAGQ